MSQRARVIAAGAALIVTFTSSPHIQADEGMWLFNAPPLERLKKTYQFEPTQQWLDHIQKSSVRFNSGGSGSFVSSNGLVMTNHHVGASDLQKKSTLEKNYLRDGFHAKTNAEEIKCEALELNCLQSIRNVTDEVNAAVGADLAPAAAFKARQAKIGEIEKAASGDDKSIRADVVTLFAGGQYHLYTYKKYTDIRIVFAPEKAIAFFGGDPDNFEYPRFDLDICFFRVYENDMPAKVEHYLKWSEAGTKEGELTFVSGHPGRTTRQNTVAELEYQRDVGYPAVLARLNRLEVLLGSWAERSAANRQRAEEDLFGIQNSRKARIGGLQGLLDPKLMDRKRAEEKRLREFIEGREKYLSDTKQVADAQAALKAFDTVAEGQKLRAKMLNDATFVAGGGAFNSSYFGYARTLVRAAAEKPKPAAERLPEFGDARLKSLEEALFSKEPHYDDFETLTLADSLSAFAVAYGADNELVKQVLAGKSPRERAFELVAGTKMRDPEVRRKLYEGGQAAIDTAADPMIAVARLVDPKARELRKAVETTIDEPRRQAYSALAKARYALDGANTYPDATFTLRLSLRHREGLQVEDGKDVPAFTDLRRACTPAASRARRTSTARSSCPSAGSRRRRQARPRKPPSTSWLDRRHHRRQLRFSPVVNAKAGEVVGLIFDGNIQSTRARLHLRRDRGPRGVGR